MPRPKGLAKTGGRKPGTLNRINAEFRDLVRHDTEDFKLVRLVANGKPVNGMKPNLDHILKANLMLLERAHPRLKVQEKVRDTTGLDPMELSTDELLTALGLASIEQAKVYSSEVDSWGTMALESSGSEPGTQGEEGARTEPETD